MHARVLTFDGADASQRDEAQGVIRGEVIPRLEQMDGFAGYMALFDADNKRATAIVLWESQEAAEAAEQELAPRRQQMIEGMGMRIASNQLLEAAIVEMRSGVRA